MSGRSSSQSSAGVLVGLVVAALMLFVLAWRLANLLALPLNAAFVGGGRGLSDRTRGLLARLPGRQPAAPATTVEGVEKEMRRRAAGGDPIAQETLRAVAGDPTAMRSQARRGVDSGLGMLTELAQLRHQANPLILQVSMRSVVDPVRARWMLRELAAISQYADVCAQFRHNVDLLLRMSTEVAEAAQQPQAMSVQTTADLEAAADDILAHGQKLRGLIAQATAQAGAGALPAVWSAPLSEASASMIVAAAADARCRFALTALGKEIDALDLGATHTPSGGA